MQLQGELAKGGAKKVYKNAIDVIVKTWRNEGLTGIQRGLGPAVCNPSTLHNIINTSRVVRIPSELIQRYTNCNLTFFRFS
jgi:hypothetical protein